MDYAPYQLLIPPESPSILGTAGFDLLSLANNHSLDAGFSGLQETTDRLQAAGLVPLAADTATYVLKENGLRVVFVALNLIPGSIVVDLDEAQAMIQSARKQADVVVVSVHWGLEYQLKPSPAQMQLADQMSKWGADLVLGHHPHVAQPLEIMHLGEGNPQRETLIAYSLGNFVFDQFDERTRQGLALRAFVDQDGLRAVQVLPVEAGLRPRLATLKDSTALLARVSPAPRRIGYACGLQECWSTPVPQEERSGIFWADQIDLTGDGVPEVVKRTSQVVVIYQDGEPVWRSPPEWKVLDVVLGDPNDDGRAEVLVALNKPGPGGTLTSHPFILGYRGGSYRVLWGGSAVSDPLLEVELGDLDGDAVDELVVLEMPKGGTANTVSVWRWHGWGFSQLWRSPEGSYRDVILLPGEDGESSRISVVRLNGDANR
jgi:poly-gamma-glutamate synthesis protein (capsule biosynthesis protein)